MRDDITTTEAEAWADGWRAAREAAHRRAAMEAVAATCQAEGEALPDPLLEYQRGRGDAATSIAAAIRAIAPPAPPARTRLGILGEG